MVHFRETSGYHSASGLYYQMACNGRLNTPERSAQGKQLNCFTEQRGGRAPQELTMLTADQMEANLKAERHDQAAAMIRSWRPPTNAERAASNPDSFCPVGEIYWDSSLLYMLPESCHRKLHWSCMNFDRTQALISYTAKFENPAETVMQPMHGPLPPPPPEQLDPDDQVKQKCPDTR